MTYPDTPRRNPAGPALQAPPSWGRPDPYADPHYRVPPPRPVTRVHIPQPRHPAAPPPVPRSRFGALAWTSLILGVLCVAAIAFTLLAQVLIVA